MLTFQTAAAEDKQQMFLLWQEAFPEDGDEDITVFLERFAEYALVAKDKDAVVSMLFLLPATLWYNEHEIPVGYIYAGATATLYRGQGWYRRLIEYAASEAISRGYGGLFLRPADEALAESYRRMGFTVPLYTAKIAPSSDNGRKTDVITYTREKHEWFSRALVPHILWSSAVTDYLDVFTTAYLTENDGVLLSSDDVCLEYVSSSAFVAEHRAGLLCSLGEDFISLPPIYMGYGLE